LNTPLVTIVTPVKNNIKYVEECLYSVVTQKYPYIEHFLVDGGSTDGTLEVIMKYQEAYPSRIRYISEPDKGSSDGLVKGMKQSYGSIIGILGSDDVLQPGAIQKVVDFFDDNPQASFVFGGCNRIDEKGNYISKMLLHDFDLNWAVNNYVSIPGTSAYFKRMVVDKVDPSVMIKGNSEIEWWLQIAQRFTIHRIEPVLSNFRIYDDKQRRDGFYINASTNWNVNKRYGASRWSPCARRYYLALLARPLSPILDPIFRYITQGTCNLSCQESA